jgi:DNA-binding MarR family transcriptional regulator
MAIDALIANPGRLRILTALASDGSQEFVRLRAATHLTDGNLSAHARRLHAAGLVDIDKSFRAGKPVTTIALTAEGRTRLAAHAAAVLTALHAPPPAKPVTVPAPEDDPADWVD